jgi:UDP-glucose 4-epimerase
MMRDYQGVVAAVLGASGFIGRWVARKLSQAGARTYLVVRDRAAARNLFEEYALQGEIIETDLLDLAELRAIYQHIRPAVTFNLAGYGVDPSERDERLAYRINAELPRELCEIMARFKDPSWPGQQIIHAGSAAEYGQAGGDLQEDGPALPETLYGKSKLKGTQLLAEQCLTFGLQGLTGRLFTVYGPGEHAGRLLPSLIEVGLKGGQLNLTSGVQRRDFTYVEDVADGLLRLGLISTNTPAVNVATGQLTPVRKFVEIAAGILSIRLANLRFDALTSRPEEMKHEAISLDRLRRLTGWIPQTEIAEGIRRTVEFRLHNSTAFLEYAD